MNKKYSLWFHFFLPCIYVVIFIIRFHSLLDFGQFAGGVFLGFGLLLMDRLLHALYVDPDAEFSQLLKSEWRQKHFTSVIKLLTQASSLQAKLTTRSLLFMLTLLAVTIYVVTSTGSKLGVGLVLGICLHYCLDIYLYRPFPEIFHQQFLWQLKKQLTPSEITQLVGGVLLSFSIISLLVLL